MSKVIQTVGGCNVLLGLIAMARDVESLYAGVKALVCVLKSNPFSRSEMEHINGYQVLAMLLRNRDEKGAVENHLIQYCPKITTKLGCETSINQNFTCKLGFCVLC